MEHRMGPGFQDESTYRDDCKAFLEFCQGLQIHAPLSLRALDFWLCWLEDIDAPGSDRRRMRTSVERLFRHIGVLPDEEPEDLELAGDWGQ